jgi:hypothetical protein
MATGVSRTLTVARRVLASIGALLVFGWEVDVAWHVLSDPQISDDTASAILAATAVVPGLIGLCLIGLLRPIFSVDSAEPGPAVDQPAPFR